MKYACEAGNCEIIKFLLFIGKDITYEISKLIINNEDLLDFFINEFGLTNLKTCSKDYISRMITNINIIYYATKNGNLEIVKYLYSRYTQRNRVLTRTLAAFKFSFFYFMR